MTTQTVEKTAVKQPSDFEQKVQKLREIYADAGEISKAALENVIRSIESGASAASVKRQDRKRRPDRCPPGKGLGVDGDRAAQARRSEAHARVF